MPSILDRRPRNRGSSSEKDTISQWVLNQAIGEFRARVDTYIAVIVESFDIDVDEELVKVMPPPVDEENQIE